MKGWWFDIIRKIEKPLDRVVEIKDREHKVVIPIIKEELSLQTTCIWFAVCYIYANTHVYIFVAYICVYLKLHMYILLAFINCTDRFHCAILTDAYNVVW
jgi:hypothetical protein